MARRSEEPEGSRLATDSKMGAVRREVGLSQIGSLVRWRASMRGSLSIGVRFLDDVRKGGPQAREDPAAGASMAKPAA